jgi:16S rRNA (cytidine1402-2'-O)-methyltransferase
MHNETGRAAELVEQLKAGARIAVVSDAGTPGIADPGAEIAFAAIAAGIPAFPIPGANAALSALIASGLPAESFTFLGFLPPKSGQRRTALEELRARAEAQQTFVVYEAPHRILDSLADIEAVFGAAQHVVIARELTKIHEEFLRGPVRDVRDSLAQRDTVRGEIVLIFAPTAAAEEKRTVSIADEVRTLMRAEGLDEKDALKRVAKARGMGKSEAYREMQRNRSR